MHPYPLLTATEQAGLPSLTQAAVRLPSKFDDSTHQVYLCDTVAGRMVLKVCDVDSVAQSGFWRGFNRLFGADFPNSLGRMQQTYDLLAKQGLCLIPDFVASHENRFVLTHYMAGEDVNRESVSDAQVVQLAKHIAQLHQHRQATWGSVHAPLFEAAAWGERLQQTLQVLAEHSETPIPKALLVKALEHATSLHETEFVPLMLDVRWDQFRCVADSDALALLDLDAFAFGPRALELVLLSYVLTPQQFALLKTTYCEVHDWPDDLAQKQSYQLLLFLMQVLGETDVTQWMRHTV